MALGIIYPPAPEVAFRRWINFYAETNRCPERTCASLQCVLAAGDAESLASRGEAQALTIASYCPAWAAERGIGAHGR